MLKTRTSFGLFGCHGLHSCSSQSVPRSAEPWPHHTHQRRPQRPFPQRGHEGCQDVLYWAWIETNENAKCDGKLISVNLQRKLIFYSKSRIKMVFTVSIFFTLKSLFIQENTKMLLYWSVFFFFFFFKSCNEDHMSPLNLCFKSSSYILATSLKVCVSEQHLHSHVCEFGDNRSCSSLIFDTQHEMTVYHSVTSCGFLSSFNWIMPTRCWHRGDTRQRELIISCKISPETQTISTTQPHFVFSSGNTLPHARVFSIFSAH